MKRITVIDRLTPYKHERNVQLALEHLFNSDTEELTNDEIHGIWHWVSKSIDVELSDDDNHPIYALESDLAASYQR